MEYKDAGVDLQKAVIAKDKIKQIVKATFDKNVLSDIGLFGGLYRFPQGMKKPVLVASTDGVGTKLRLAYISGDHTKVGQDLVNHCVNDILVQGARPLFFLDYIALEAMDPNVVEQIVTGMTLACKQNKCALIGGETAAMPSLYKKGEYDIAGFIVGVVEEDKIIDGKTIEEGDCIIGIESSGLHTNGYSLAQKALFEKAGLTFDAEPEGFEKSIGEMLMATHLSYLHPVWEILPRAPVHGMAHITGGGLLENIPRILPKHLNAIIDTSSWVVPPLFTLIAKSGQIAEEEMFRSFNMGIGYVMIVPKESVDTVTEIFKKHNLLSFLVGEIKKGEKKVILT